jgi:hypothetical protein
MEVKNSSAYAGGEDSPEKLPPEPRKPEILATKTGLLLCWKFLPI